MACTSQSASEYIKNGRKLLVGKLHDLPLIVENLFQSKVLHEEEVRKIQTEVEQFDKTEEILDWVMEKGEAACYELLVILDRTKKKTLDDPDLEHWISCFPFREDLEMTDHLVGLKPCQRYQTLLKRKAQKIAEDARKQSCGLLPESCRKEVSFSYTPLVLDTDVYSTLSKIKLKSKKGRKTRHKKLKSFIPVARQETSLAGLLDTNESKILLVGKPGIGKTTVTHQMLRLWSEKDHRELDYMFYFNMRDISFRTNPRCLEDLLFNMYCEPEESREEVLEDIKKNSENAVIIFDGITDLSSNLVIKELLSHKLLPDAKIVITCRPEVHFEDFLTDFPTDWFRVEVKGFCDESIKAYLTKMLNAQPESLNSVLNNLELFSLCHVPMYALMVVACICSTPEASKQSWTTTTMYINILRHCIQEHSGKQLKDSQCLAEHREKILSLAEIAYKATEQKTMNLATLSHEEGSPQCAFLGAVMVKVLPTYSAFLHHTMQEFFGALWLLQNPDRIRDVLKKCQTKEWNHLMYLVPYLCGLLNEMNICLVDRLVPASQIKLTSDWFFKKLVKTFLPPERYNDHADCSATEFEIDLVFLCQCLYESQSSVACLLFLEKMDYHLDLSGEHLDPHHCCAVSYVISQSAENKVGLDLDSCTVSEQGLRLILGSLKNVRYLGSTPSILCQLWITLLSVEEEMDFTSLLGLCENELHLPVQAESRVFERAEDVMKQSSERVNLCLHWNQRTLLSEALNKTILECLSNINKLSFAPLQDQRGSLESLEKSVLLHLCLQAAFYHRETFLGAVNTLLSMFSVYQTERYDILLDLYSYVKNKINQSDRSLLLLLTPLYQSAPAVWSIDLSERKTSLLLEVLKLQPEKKLVELKGWSDEESEVRSFLQCLPYISQLSFYLHRSKHSEQIQFLVDLLSQAAEWEEETGEKKLKLVSSVCSYSTFPFRNWDSYDEEKTYQSEFLLDLYSHVKDYETQTGRSVLPSLQPVYQSASPAVWSIDLSERKTSFLLEVLKLQPEKKPVKLKGWSDEESEVRSFLQCLPYISKLRLLIGDEKEEAWSFLSKLIIAAAEYETKTGENVLKKLSSMCRYKENEDDDDPFIEGDFLLDLYSHVKHYETQTGRSVLPALQPVYQSAHVVWSIDLSERKTSLLLEVLKLQPEKKPVKLKGWSDEESEVRSFLQCLPYISQLRLLIGDEKEEAWSFLSKLIIAAAEYETKTGENVLKKLSSMCRYKENEDDDDPFIEGDFLLDLYSHVKHYETQTGRSVLPALQPVYQSAHVVWSIDLSERKTSLLLEVLKLQPEKKPVELKGWSDEESEVRSFLQCLPYISQLSFTEQYQRRIPEEWRQREKTFLLNVCLQAVINEQRSLQTTLETVLSVFEVCQYQQWDLVLDLYSYVKDYETHTGRSVLPALQPVYQSAPPVWSIDLSERKTSILLEVLKLQPEKKPVVLKGWSDEESDVRSFLQCLPYISQLSCDDQFFLCLCEALSVGSEWDAHLCTSLLHAVDYTVVLSGWLPSVTCRTVGAVLGQSASGGKLNITLTPQSMSFQGARQLFKKVENLHKLRVNEMAVLKLARMAKFGSCHNPVLIEEMILDLSSPAVPEGVLRRVISSLASLLRCWPIRSLDLTDCQIEGYLLTSLLCHQGHLCTFRLNGESMQQLTDVVYEAQDKELTQCFLVKFGHDLSYCTLNWDVLQYLLQSTTQPITVNLRRSQFKPKDIIHLLPCLTNIHFKRINSRFKRTALREIYKQRAGHMVTTLLKSSDEWINLNNLVLDRYDCEALRFALHYSDGVKLNLLWTIVPKTEMRNILGLLHRVLTLRIDRELLLELLHACRDFGLQKTAVDLLRLLDHKLDLSCSSAMDLSRQEEGTVLSLTTGDCMVIASAVQVADCNTEINLHDCQVGNAGLEELIPVLHRVHLSIGKQILLQFLHLISVRDGDRSGRLALFLSRALGKELDLSQTPLDLVACSSLALILEYSEGLSELDLHNCNLTDNHLNCLLMHLHKVQVLNLSNNEVTDQGAIYVKDKLSRNGFTGTVWLHSRKATKPDNVLPEDKRYKVCLTYGESKRFSKTKAHFKEFDPVMKLVEGRISYSFQFGSRGRFKCTATGLIFGMKEPGTMEYSVEDWDMGILANTSYEPAGPLFQLNSPEGDIYQLQLPHCETEVYSAEDLHVAHMCINNMEFLRPKKVTQSHVIVAICGLSRFGNVRKRPFYQNRVQVKVGLFLEPDVTPTRQRLWVFLLPRNVPFTEVKEQHKEFVFIKTSPYCILRPKAKYSLTSDLKLGFKVQPKKYILHFDSSNDHHATFEVFLNHDITELHLKIQERTRLKALIRWSRLVILKTKSAKVSVQKLTESQWIESLCSILEQLTNKQMKKLKSLMMTTKERSHISKSTLEGLEDHCDVAQQMVWAWGMNGSIMATREFMDKLQRQDECVMSLLQPFLDQCDPM